MQGKVIVVSNYSKPLISANPSVLFAFQDNLERIGFAGQSEHCRKLKNTIGIPCMLTPTRPIFDDMIGKPIKGIDFEYDGPYGLIIKEIIQAFVTLRLHLRSGKDIAWPEEGMDTNQSRLSTCAPLLLQGIELAKQKVFSEAQLVTFETH